MISGHNGSRMLSSPFEGFTDLLDRNMQEEWLVLAVINGLGRALRGRDNRRNRVSGLLIANEIEPIEIRDSSVAFNEIGTVDREIVRLARIKLVLSNGSLVRFSVAVVADSVERSGRRLIRIIARSSSAVRGPPRRTPPDSPCPTRR